MYKYPLFEINYGEEEKKSIIKTLDSKWISTGPKCEEFENLFSKKNNVKFSLTTSSCTSSLHMSLIALDIKQGDEILVPSLTFSATVNIIKYMGAKPIFCDIISESNLNIDPLEIERKITKKSKAIIVMHYAGFPCEMEKILEITRRHKLYLIEDAAHAPLSEFKGKKLGSFGDIGTFSFFSNKNIAIGEGGMLVTNNSEIYEKAKLIRSHGMTTLSYARYKGHATEYDIKMLGYNYRMDDIRASLGIIQLKKLKKDIFKRERLRETYIELLKNNSKVIIPFIDNKNFVSNYIFPIVLKNSTKLLRDKVRMKLNDDRIQTSIHYPPVHKFSIYKEDYVDLPITDYVSDNQITLPMHSKLKTSDIDFIVSKLSNLLKDEKQKKD
tara:strand:+ start:1375 stop:2523 length:1149 start_codon:yes stop_codon:yes gene_type:complete